MTAYGEALSYRDYIAREIAEKVVDGLKVDPWLTETYLKAKAEVRKIQDEIQTPGPTRMNDPMVIASGNVPGLTADQDAAVKHDTWSWGCKVPTDERPNGDALDALAVCPVCEPTPVQTIASA